MEILGTISAVDSLCGTVISLVKKFVEEVKRARNDVATLLDEVENLQAQYETLSDRVTQVKETCKKLHEVHIHNPKLGEAQNKIGELKKLLERLEKSLKSDEVQIRSFRSVEPERRSMKGCFKALKYFKAFIGKGAAQVQRQIRKILKRLEADCSDLDKAITALNFAGTVRMEAGIDRVERGVEQGFKGVMERLPMIPDPQSSGTTAQALPEYPVAMEERASLLEETVNSLKDGQVVGIYGMGGIGKTTLAKQVFNNISKKFVYTCFVNDVKSIQPHELEEKILKKFQKIGGTSSLTSWADLTRETTLIIMDDIDRDTQLESVLLRRCQFRKGSVVMFTTRNSNICNKEYKVSFQVPFLEVGDARKLLCKHAFNEEDIPERLQAEMSTYVEEVVEKCDGLPLSLEVIGSYLYGKDAETWAGTIRRFSKAQSVDGAKEDSLFATLEVSYDCLDKEEQQMFRDIATFFVGEPLDVALAAMSTSCTDSKTCWEHLVQRCLVKEKMEDIDSTLNVVNIHLKCGDKHDGNLFETRYVWMHEHLQDLGKKLAKNSGEYDAANNIVEEINSYKGPGEIKLLRSVSFSFPDSSAEQMSWLAKLTELKYLRLYLDENPLLEFPADLALLQLSGLHRGLDFPSRLYDMKHLTVLKLASHIAEHFFQPPDSFRGWTKLKILVLGSKYSINPTKFKDLPESFGKLLISLEVLVLDHMDITHLPESFGNLSSLKTLAFDRCNKLTHLPESFGNLSSLRTLNMSDCSNLKLPTSFSKLSGLCFLYCPGTQLVEFGAAFPDLSWFQLQVLQLELENANVPSSFSQLSGCKTLQYVELILTQEDSDTDVCWDLSPLEGWTLQGKELIALSQELGRRMSGDRVDLEFELDKGSAGSSQPILAMTAIEIARYQGVPSFLQRPELLDFSQVQIFPKSLETMPLLREWIEELDLEQDFPKSMDTMPLLREWIEELDLEQDDPIDELDLKQDDLIGELDLKQDYPIEKLDLKQNDPFPRLRELREWIENSHLEQDHPIEELDLKQEDPIEKSETEGEESDSEEDDISLQLREMSEELALYEDNPIEEANSIVGNRSSNLMVTRVRFNPQLKTPPNSSGQLGSLQRLRISYWPLETLHESLGQLRSLNDLSILTCRKLKALPESLGQLGSLAHLYIHECDKLRSLPESLGNLVSLDTVIISQCRKLKAVPQKIKDLVFYC